MSKPWNALLPVALEALLLMVVSRLLFAGVLSAVADRRGKGFWLGVLRLPGNLLHELSHCLGFWVCGYRVTRVLLCIFDPRGRGCCQPGKPWSPITFPWLATGLAALMPMVIGSAVLVLAGHGLGVVRRPLDLHEGQLLAGVADEALALLHRLNWHQWQTYGFLYLALSIGAEVAPSDTDLRHGLPALLALFAGCWLFFFAASHAPGLREAGAGGRLVLQHAAQWLGQVWTVTLVMTSAATALALLPALVMRAVRQ
jgi:hypothetical protein